MKYMIFSLLLVMCTYVSADVVEVSGYLKLKALQYNALSEQFRKMHKELDKEYVTVKNDTLCKSYEDKNSGGTVCVYIDQVKWIR